jgi:hypothetical protein
MQEVEKERLTPDQKEILILVVEAEIEQYEDKFGELPK